jgi:glycosyltransferase involved in cell wall biosynthesis
MKFCLVSTSAYIVTGYSKVSYYLLRELRKIPNLQLYHYTLNSSNTSVRPKLDDITTQDNYEETANFGGLQAFCESNGFGKDDVVFIYNDIAYIGSFLEKWTPPRLWVYVDTVAHGIPPVLLKLLDDKAERIYLFNEYWKSVYPFDKAYVLEHGVDKEVVRPLPKEKIAEMREKLGIPNDAIVFLNANRNSRRKRLDLCISAFVQFCKRNPKKVAYLLLLTGSEGYYDIGTVLYSEIRRHGHDCSKRVLSINTSKILLTDEIINEFYNMSDYGINTSTGEGYGLTVLEHASLGKPQVLTYLPQYESFITKRNAVFVRPLPDREYYDKTDWSGAYHDTWSSADICVGMENVLGKRCNFKAKTWQNVFTTLVTALAPADATSNASIDLPLTPIHTDHHTDHQELSPVPETPHPDCV